MKDDNKTKKQLINELTELRSQNAALNQSMAGSISAEPAAEEALRYAESIVETVREPLLVLDEDLKIISANRNFYRTFKVTPDETIGSFIYDLGNKQWDIPKLRKLLEEVLREKQAFDDFEFAHTFQDIGHKIMLLNARQIYRKDIGAKLILLAIEDITESKLEGVKFRTLVEAIPQKIFTKNKDSVYVTANENYARDLGITNEEFVGKNDYTFFPKELADKYRADDKRIMESGNTEDIEEQYVKNGKTFWVHTTKTPLRDDQGNITGILGIFDDITEQRLAHHALQEREERYRSLVDAIGQSNIGILIVDADYRVRFMNKPMIMAFGDQTGRICYEGVGKANSPCSYCKLDEVIQQGRVVTYQPTTTNGKTYDIVAVPYKDTDGAICKLEILRDITENKLVERALLESNQRLRRLYESGMLGVLYWNMNGQITDANDKFLEMVGYTRDDLESGKIDWINMTPPEFRHLDDNSVMELKSTGVNKTPFEKEYIRKDGTRMPIILAGAMLDEDKFNGVAFVLDITERKQAEIALLQSEERYRSIFETAQEGIFQTSSAGRFLAANRALGTILGYDSPEDLMTNITDIEKQLYVNPEDRRVLLEMIEKKGSIREFEVQVYRKNGSMIWLSLNQQAVRDAGGHLLYYEGFVEDITIKKENMDRMRKALGATVQAIAVTVETRDPYTAGHQRRVSDLARAIATEMNLLPDQIDGIRTAAIIHDLGKISVPAEILSKPTKLTNIEFDLIKTHSQSGYDILKDIDFPWPVARAVLEHHERMNGSGYPNGLTGDNILLESRILAVADVVEAIASHRPYRPTLGINAALEEIEKNKGTFYDNTVADACLRLFREKGFKLEGK